MALIIDLDQTIVDSSSAEHLRKERKWSDVYKLIPSFILYEGISELIKELRKKGIKVAVVTSSPSTYAKKVLEHFMIEVDVLVCYHDTKLRKPNPDPINHAIQKLAPCSSVCISIGDHENDIIASKSAGIKTVGCTWGCISVEELKKSSPDYLAEKISDLKKILFNHFKFSNCF